MERLEDLVVRRRIHLSHERLNGQLGRPESAASSWRWQYNMNRNPARGTRPAARSPSTSVGNNSRSSSENVNEDAVSHARRSDEHNVGDFFSTTCNLLIKPRSSNHNHNRNEIRLDIAGILRLRHPSPSPPPAKFEVVEAEASSSMTSTSRTVDEVSSSSSSSSSSAVVTRSQESDSGNSTTIFGLAVVGGHALLICKRLWGECSVLFLEYTSRRLHRVGR